MISRELAVALKRAGLVWHPESGDRFQVDLPGGVEVDLDADVFTVSEMTIESHRTSAGTILGFNGTTEWALDSLTLEDAVWLPREDQLRELLRGTFRSLRRLDDAFEVEVEIAGERLRYEHPDASEAYAMALLELVSRSR
ncbi:pilus assembly protein CpaE [Agromyces intestinalis]|uniref:Pilus assembly protein CpaE n=2 Tax=Agromyces TaxID=33877 RepID=A0A5C1YIA0_9MICO|nr:MULTISPECIES: pilus assembly protein CpaE [Agromyces]QEO14767.1 pilus assembly protein CpaE [Agromyces intestinalis]UOE43056.1 pilus assembly protein CpaE [Agromyces larvae]